MGNPLSQLLAIAVENASLTAEIVSLFVLLGYVVVVV